MGNPVVKSYSDFLEEDIYLKPVLLMFIFAR